ncbi:MAG: fatty acid desaturase [Sutterellaceae bacterium]|nr:fatty acid desaturase [Burkholderiaceae bacterium]MCX7900803.1 fatty acid desaturase [Burkholderiaceae bacterium]MDW8430490.1 fatty acid desaturase [Sutterellaceae bacterium]
MFFLEFMDGGLLGLAWWQLVLVTLALTHVTIASVTIFLHRSQAHRALDLHPIASHFFRFWLWLTTGMVTREWVAVHRKHHAKCETPEDPHSPQIKGIRKVLWEGAELYMAEAANAETLARYGHGTPDDWLERNIYSRFTWQGVALMLGIDLLLFGWAGLAVWGVQMLWIPFFAAGVINGIGHYWGYRNYDSPDAATNIMPWGILIGGEELHNNHHTYPTSAKLSSKWYEFDLGWLYIRLLQMLGLARVLRLAPVPKVTRPKARIDLDTLQAVVSYRYDLLARYARGLRDAYRMELQRLRAAGADARRFRALKSWLRKGDLQSMPPAQQQTLRELLAHSWVLRTLIEMRVELAAVWSRSAHSREQMLAHLQDWIARAEASGIRALQDLALRIRSYVPARA